MVWALISTACSIHSHIPTHALINAHEDIQSHLFIFFLSFVMHRCCPIGNWPVRKSCNCGIHSMAPLQRVCLWAHRSLHCHPRPLHPPTSTYVCIHAYTLCGLCSLFKFKMFLAIVWLRQCRSRLLTALCVYIYNACWNFDNRQKTQLPVQASLPCLRRSLVNSFYRPSPSLRQSTACCKRCRLFGRIWRYLIFVLLNKKN